MTGDWWEIIRIAGCHATREWAQEKKIRDMLSLLYQQYVDIVATNEPSVHTVNALIVRDYAMGKTLPPLSSLIEQERQRR
jgi:hypothetical protein